MIVVTGRGYNTYISFMDNLCKGCENNCGGACAYDLANEAEWRGVRLDTIRRIKMDGQESYCAYFDRREEN